MPVPPSSRPSSASKAPKRLFSAPYQKSRIDFEVFNAWIYNLASSFSALSNSLSEGSGARPQTVQLKSGVEGFGGLSEEPVFPAFRFYNPGAHAYLAKRNTSKEVVTQDRDPFSNQTIYFLVEWEWIPQPKSLGAFLRHKASKMFLCFNRHGKPTVQKRIKISRCLIHGFLPRRDLIDTPAQPKSENRQLTTSQAPMISTKSTSQLQLMSSSNLTSAQMKRSLRRYLKRRDNLAKFSIPAAVHLASKSHIPPWHIGFCPNGRAFANRQPYMATCPNFQLSKKWNLLYICPPIPNHCRRPECLLAKRILTQLNGCPRACQLSIYCGNMSNVFLSVNL
ncbi:unnamed protein product [Mesocestoides corti]|uniref:Uncharacterized protein n=1 Tax=Mesocestoides corti TaxID=53468 RepID=A0A0R3U697_MESCO|nr:unnamed protein product [Mesocestoides corti]